MVLSGVLVAAAGSKLCDSLDTNVLRFQLLPDDALRHTSIQILNEKLRAAVVREIEGV